VEYEKLKEFKPGHLTHINTLTEKGKIVIAVPMRMD
tara:strand:- start:113 stop:220 length:108 start_codon:yes stop_codon:yes gene_type:complete